ncbi:complement factor B-like, partial [Malurus melanocephalus]|uniref:complement factor B-like n=1 Tax=Malurus melanocephalus TaxID=175006 RepID=UPI002546D5C9
VWCPGQLQFDHGSFWPRGSRHRPGSVLRFSCQGGFELRGPRERRCGPGGRWEGPHPVCDDGTGDCPAPAVPPGASMEGPRSRFSVEGSVRFRCSEGLQLLGSAERRCLEGGTWSGSEPRCRDPNSFDSPEDVAEAFLASLTQTVEAAEANRSHDPTVKRRIRLEAGGALNVFLVLDASRSVSDRDYEEARDALVELVEKIASYGAAPRYGVVTFGSEARKVLSPTEPRAAEAATVKEKLRGLRLQGRANMGGSPTVPLLQIREFLSIGRDPLDPREEFLDVYVFGLGDNVHTETLNALASHKPHEEHVFVLEGMDRLQETFHRMIDESSTLDLCGVSLEFSAAEDRQRNPWEVAITVTAGCCCPPAMFPMTPVTPDPLVTPVTPG